MGKISNFFLAGSDRTQDIKANKVAAWTGKFADFCFAPARHLFNGSSVSWVRKKADGELKPKADLSHSTGVTKFCKTLVSLAAVLPGTIIGTPFEFALYCCSKRTRKLKASAGKRFGEQAVAKMGKNAGKKKIDEGEMKWLLRTAMRCLNDKQLAYQLRETLHVQRRGKATNINDYKTFVGELRKDFEANFKRLEVLWKG